MERHEPSLIPEWLKGASGSALASPQSAFFQDGGSTQVLKPRATQQGAGGHTDYDSPRGAASSERSFFASGRRNHASNLPDRTVFDRDILSQGRLHSNLTRSSSSKQSFASIKREKEWEGNRLEVTRERDWVQDGERSVWSREVEGLSGIVSVEKKKERECLENGRLRLIIPGNAGTYDSDAKLRRPQPMGLSPRLSDSSAWKGIEGVTASLPTPSVSGGLPTSIQKAAFERNFPSLGIDDKPVGLVGSTMNSPVASPRTFWSGPARSDLGRASSPGLVGSMGGPSVTLLSINGGSGGSDSWNSVLAELPPLNDNMQNISLGLSALSCSSSSSSYIATSSTPIPATASATMNMAEALSQPPQRVRTPPHSAAESQRLEELALKQSRQLIPMTPSLPKTMSLSDKGKSKTNRAVDASRSSSSSRPDTPKNNQGKLLVLKANRDGGMLATSGLKSEGNNTTQFSPQGMNIGTSAQQRKPSDHRGSQPGSGCVDTLAGVRSKDPMEDKRPLMQAQNRSDFFNTLRKKAAIITPKLDSCQLDSVGVSSEVAVLVQAGTPSHVPGIKLGGGATDCTSHLHSNGGTNYVARKGSVPGEGGLCIECVSPAIKCAEEIVTVDSEEEEAAFMRSLGWEEDAEDSELTEEEINAFYQMQARRKFVGIEAHSNIRVEPSVNNSGIYTSSSASESDDELPAQKCR